MELKEFISTSLTEIFDGIIEAQNHLSQSGDGLINPVGNNGYKVADGHISMFYSETLTKIKFKVAVLASDKQGISSGITVFTGFLGAGTKAGAEYQDSVTSTIEFDVPVCLPAQRDRTIDTPDKVQDMKSKASSHQG